MPERKGRHPMPWHAVPHNQTDPAEIPSLPENSSLVERGSQGETDIQSFIVKVWLGEIRGAPGWPTWRGYITHVPSGHRRYLKKLGDVIDFMVSYIYPQVTRFQGGKGLIPFGEGRRKRSSFSPFRTDRRPSSPAGALTDRDDPHRMVARLKQNKRRRSVQKGRRPLRGWKEGGS